MLGNTNPLSPCAAFGQILRDLRRERGLSQEALALEAGLQRNYISLIERGVNQPTITTVFKLASALAIRPSEVIARVERRANYPSITLGRL
ncbi:MAG: helix-turn-helix transcriptional regulator [Betaproteobacteria bacterium]|nr:helix-turn-helix transcriptional regulator [Betaproteobacteria bacterium]